MDEDNKKVGSYDKRPMWQWLLVYAVIAVVAYGGFYYFVLAKSSGSNNSQTGAYQQNPSPATTQAPAPVVVVEKITIEGNEFAFTPSTVPLKKGQTAEITFKNTGKFPHNLDIKDLGITTKTIMPGEQDTITFTPDKTGSFSFLCSVGTHAEKGMIGTIIIK